MFWIARVLQTLILPPGLFVLIAALVVLFLALRKARVALWLSVLALVAGLALSLEPVAAALILPLESRYQALSPVYASGEAFTDSSVPESSEREIPEEASHIVVLGGGSEINSPEAEAGTLATDALKRTVYGHQLHMSSGLPVVLTGGRPAGRPDAPAEAELAAALMRSLGSTEEQLLLESESRDTWENARYVDGLICNETVVLVTSAYHMPRAVRSFAAHGFMVVPAPTDYKAERAGYTLDSFLPSIQSLYESTRALHEYLGLAYYRFRTPDPQESLVKAKN